MTAFPPDVAVRLLGAAACGPDTSSRHAAAAKAVVRYADPLSWAVVGAVGAGAAAYVERLEHAGMYTSLIHVAPHGPAEAMTRVQRDAREGHASPVRFPASAPSAPAGLACLAFGLRGPSLCLTMPLERGTSCALTLAAAWLARGMAELCLLVVTRASESASPRAACALLARGNGGDSTPDVGATLRALLQGTP